MTLRDEAATFDAQDRPMEAAHAYEAAIAAGDADLETYLDLAVLYFECIDGGYMAHHRLPVDFLQTAWDGMLTTLDAAERRYGAHSEITFWRRYFRYIYIGGDPLTEEECQQLLATGETLVPTLFLFGSFAGLTNAQAERYRPQAAQLLSAVQAGVTARQRYIRSVLKSAFNHRQQRAEGRVGTEAMR